MPSAPISPQFDRNGTVEPCPRRSGQVELTSYHAGVTEQEYPSAERLALPAVLFALSEPARLAIVGRLAAPDAEATCQSVALDMPKSTRSHHLKVLREAGIIRMAPRGRERLLTLRRQDLDLRWPGLLTAVLDDAVHAEPSVDGRETRPRSARQPAAG